MGFLKLRVWAVWIGLSTNAVLTNLAPYTAQYLNPSNKLRARKILQACALNMGVLRAPLRTAGGDIITAAVPLAEHSCALWSVNKRSVSIASHHD